MPFRSDFIPLDETEELIGPQHHDINSSGNFPTVNSRRPEQSAAGQSLIISRFLHTPVLPRRRTLPRLLQEPGGHPVLREPAFPSSRSSQESYRASLRPSLPRHSSTTFVPSRDISTIEQASIKKLYTPDPSTRPEDPSLKSSFLSPLQAGRTSYLAPLRETSIPSYLFPSNHPPKFPKTERNHPAQQLKPSEQISSHRRDEADSFGRSSCKAPPLPPEVIIHAPTPLRIHSQPTTISNTGPLRPLQSPTIPDIPYEGVRRGWSTASSVFDVGSGVQPYRGPSSQPYHLREPAIFKRLKSCRIGPERSLKDEAFLLPRRVPVPTQPVAHQAALGDSSGVIAHTSHVGSPLVESREVFPPGGENHGMQSNTWAVAPTFELYDRSFVARPLVLPPIDSAETVLDDFVVESAVTYASVTHEVGSRGSDVADRARKLCDSFLSVFQDLEKYKRFLDNRGERAQRIIDSIQSLLDGGFVDQQFRVILVVALSRLARKSELYPTRFFLHDVTRLGGTIIEGRFGEIEKGLFSGKNVCIKIPRFKTHKNSDTRSYRRALSREIMPWAQISHENILPFYGIYPLGDQYGRFGIVSPFFENGDVVDFLVKFPNADRRSFIYDVADGMSHLHDNGIVHGDIKGQNILVTDGLPPRAVLADFGFATVTDTNGLRSPDLSSNGAEGGTKQFEAPELFDPNVPYRRTKASDVYAFSMTCYQILSGDIPFPGRHGNHVMIMVGRGERPRRPVGQIYYDRGLDNIMWKLMEDCWEQDSGRRPSARKVLERLSQTSTAISQCSHHDGRG